MADYIVEEGIIANRRYLVTGASSKEEALRKYKQGVHEELPLDIMRRTEPVTRRALAEDYAARSN
jgi:hypothetical protein